MIGKTIAVSGASGFIGRHLCEALEKDHRVIKISRKVLLYDRDTLDVILSGCDVVINLNGASILKRWTRSYKETMWYSRIDTTRCLRESLNRISLADDRERVFISTSAVGIYPPGGPYKETDDTSGPRFLQRLCREWEQEAMYPASSTVRTVIFRLSSVASIKYGFFASILRLARLRVFVSMIDKKNPLPMIVLGDLIRSYSWAISHPNIRGVYNMSMPEQNRQQNLYVKLQRVNGPMLHVVMPDFLIRLVMGDGVAIFSDTASVETKKWEETGFEYIYTKIDNCLNSI